MIQATVSAVPSTEGTVSSLSESYAACLALCRSHYENFPVASRFLPEDRRAPIAAVYAFARIADDFADEPGCDDAERMRLLAEWRGRLKTCLENHRNHPVFWALSDTIRRFDLPLDPFERLLTAFEMDVTKNRYATFEEVLFYCRHSANPVGELVLRISGEWTERRGKWSDDICTALQLTNFWQDVTIDAQKNRIYVPLADLNLFEVSENDFMKGPATDAMRELIASQSDRTWSLFLSGRSLCDDVSPALRRELRFVWLGGTRILEKIDARRWDVWSKRPRLTKWDWAGLVPRGLFWRSK
jgi:hydroxysqualene synthase